LAILPKTIFFMHLRYKFMLGFFVVFFCSRASSVEASSTISVTSSTAGQP
jgi:hypothetical protein